MLRKEDMFKDMLFEWKSNYGLNTLTNGVTTASNSADVRSGFTSCKIISSG